MTPRDWKDASVPVTGGTTVRVLFVVDPLDGLDVSVDTSIGLMHAVQDIGGEVWTTEARHLEVHRGAARAWAQPIVLAPANRATGHTWTVPSPWLTTGDARWLALDETQAVFMRVDPPVDEEYVAATLVLDLVDASRTALINSPAALRTCSEHMMALAYADLIPPTTVTANADTIKAFLNEHGPAVIKPVDSYSGLGAFLLSPGDPNLNSIIESTTNLGRRVIVVHQFLSQVRDGSKRIVVLDGAIIGAGLRHPVTGDFRISNPDTPANITERDLLIVDRIRPALRDHGLRLVCLDVIGEFLIEVNITSPGALRKLDALLGTRLCADVVQSVLTRPTSWT